nr:hypothetical protein BaRGS_025755 [Batillaria attramentaria]
MSEVLSFFGRQRQRLGRRFQSLFGIVDDHTDLSNWKDKFEKQQADGTFGVEMGSILPDDDELPRALFLDDVKGMLDAVSKEDEELAAASELLKKEFEAIGDDMYDPEWQKLWRKYSSKQSSDAKANGSLGNKQPSQHCKRTTFADSAGSGGGAFCGGSEQHGHFQDTDNFLGNMNNCAQENETEESTVVTIAAGNIQNYDKNKLQELQMNAEGGGKISPDPKIESGQSEMLEPKRKKRPFSNKYASPKIKRRATSLDDLCDLGDLGLVNNAGFDDLLSEAELAAVTPRSDPTPRPHQPPRSGSDELETKDQSEITVAADELGAGITAENTTTFEPKRRERFFSRKLKHVFSLGRKYKQEEDTAGFASIEVGGAYHEFVSAQRTRSRQSLPKVANQAQDSDSHSVKVADVDLDNTWWEFLDAISSGSSDTCTWEELVQLAGQKPDSEQQLAEVKAKSRDVTVYGGATAMEDDSIANFAGLGSRSGLLQRDSEPEMKSDATTLDRGDLTRPAHRASKMPVLPRVGTLPESSGHSSDGHRVTVRSSSSSGRLESAGRLLERDTNVSMSGDDRTSRINHRVNRHASKRNSAPELRPLMAMDLEPTCLSHHDLPITDRCDMEGGYPMELCPKDDNAPTFLWGEAGYRHYKLLMAIETKHKIQKIKDAKQSIINKYQAKQQALQHIMEVAKAYYSNPTGKNREEWKKLRKEINQSSVHSITDIRHKLSQIPDYMPYFTIFLILAQVVSLTAMCTFGGITQIGVLSIKEQKSGFKTFLGTEDVVRWNTPNPWIGPPIRTVLAAGASLAPCLRHDRYVREFSRQHKYQKIDNTSFGCCQTAVAAGTTQDWECKNLTFNRGKWGSPFCSRRPPGQNNIAHVIRPCCVDHRGTCQMLSHEHCSFLHGRYHPQKEHCVEVNCVQQACKIGKRLYLIDSDPKKPWLPDSGDRLQWWRLLLSLVLTYGILHCLPLLVIEWLLMRPLEKSAGWLRIVVIYTICGIAGQIVAGIVQPYVPHVGSTSGVAGMVGEAAVELSQAWYLLTRPRIEALKLGCFLTYLLIMGLLPYVSLFGIITGVACGSLCALILMPYITFDSQSNHRRVLLVCVGSSLLLCFLTAILFVFVQLKI